MTRSINPRVVLCLSLLMLGVTAAVPFLQLPISSIPTTPPAYPGLKGKKTVVVCRAESLEYSDPLIGRELAGKVGIKLMQNTDQNIDVIDDQSCRLDRPQ